MDHHPDHARHRAGDRDLPRAEQRHRVEAEVAGGDGGELGVEVVGGGEQAADHRLGAQVVAVDQLAHQLLGCGKDRPGLVGLRLSGAPHRKESLVAHRRESSQSRETSLAGEAARLAFGEVRQGDRAEADSAQGDDAVADGLGHAADLAVAPLAQDDLDLALAEATDLGGRRHTVLQLHPPLQLAQVALRGRAAQLDPIGLRHLVAGMGEAIGQLAVIGEQQQAGRVGVEPAHRVEPGLGVDQRDHSRPIARLLRGRDHPRRLVHRPNLPRLCPDRAPIHPHVIPSSNISRRVGDDLPAHRHPPLAMISSAFRREATPPWARNFAASLAS